MQLQAPVAFRPRFVGDITASPLAEEVVCMWEPDAARTLYNSLLFLFPTDMTAAVWEKEPLESRWQALQRLLAQMVTASSKQRLGRLPGLLMPQQVGAECSVAAV